MSDYNGPNQPQFQLQPRLTIDLTLALLAPAKHNRTVTEIFLQYCKRIRYIKRPTAGSTPCSGDMLRQSEVISHPSLVDTYSFHYHSSSGRFR